MTKKASHHDAMICCGKACVGVMLCGICGALRWSLRLVTCKTHLRMQCPPPQDPSEYVRHSKQGLSLNIRWVKLAAAKPPQLGMYCAKARILRRTVLYSIEIVFPASLSRSIQ